MQTTKPNRRGPTRRIRPGAALACIALAAGLGAAAGCDPAPEPTAEAEGLTADEFVEVVAEIREAERALADADSAATRFAERKARILAAHDVTEEELREFVETRGRDTELLAEVWDSLTERLKHVQGEASLPPERSLGPRVK